MALSVKTVLGLVIVVNVITVSFFLFANNQNSISTTPESGSDRNEHKWNLKPLNKFRYADKPSQIQNSNKKADRDTQDNNFDSSTDAVDLFAGDSISQDDNKDDAIHNNNEKARIDDKSIKLPKNDDNDDDDDDNQDSDDDDEPLIDNDDIVALEKNVEDLNKKAELHRKYISQANPFRLLGFYKEVDPIFFEDNQKKHPYYDSPHTGLKKNPGYCDYSDLYNYFNPSNVFDQMYFATDHPRTLIRTDVIEKIGVDVMPQISISMDGFSKELYDLDIRATMFFMKKVDFHFFQEIGKQFLCVSQMYNHIPGHSIMTRKESLVGIVNAHADYYKQKPQCFNKDMFFPASYRLRNATECHEFFNHLNSEAYLLQKKQNPLNYISKAGHSAHRASGVYLFDEAEEERIRGKYQNGSLCGKIETLWLIQKYIKNPLLLDRHNKFDFRMYMLIASVNPLIVYYHDGFLRISFETYDPNSKDRSVHLTNTHLSKQKIEEIQNETLRAELSDYQMWTLSQLQDFLLKIGKITDPNWLDNYLRPQFKKAYLHLIKMSRASFWNHSSIYEMSGLDFMLDDNLQLWLIEANGSPQLVGTSAAKQKLMIEMLSGMFEIQYAYLRSKVKRLFAIVDKYYSELHSNKAYDIEAANQEFSKANRNFLEPEWNISSKNTWQKIFDENIPGKAAYMGILDDECILDR